MNTHNYNEAFLDIVKQNLPANIEPVSFFMDALYIGKQSAYRRLRGEVPLLLEEALLIAQKLEISLDGMFKIGSEKKLNFFMRFPEFNNPSEADYRALQDYIDEVQFAEKTPDSQLNIATNTIPQQLYLQYENITRFFLFMRDYAHREKGLVLYSQIVITARLKQIFKDSFDAHTRFKNIRFVLDKYVLLYLIRNIHYFYDIKLITPQEVQLICEDLYKLLNYLEKIAITGKNENGAQISLYISNINFDKNCTTLKMGDRHVSIVETYILNGVGTNDKGNYDRMEGWISSRCRLSTMISSCGELFRIAFFREQRCLVDDLLKDCLILKNSAEG